MKVPLYIGDFGCRKGCRMLPGCRTYPAFPQRIWDFLNKLIHVSQVESENKRMRPRHAPKGQRAHSPGHRPGYDEAAQQKYPGGLQPTVWGESLLPILLSRIGLAISVPVLPISDAVHCNRSRSALQPPLQCTASVLAVHCILHASTSNLSPKYVHPSPQVRASVLASTCV